MSGVKAPERELLPKPIERFVTVVAVRLVVVGVLVPVWPRVRTAVLVPRVLLAVWVMVAVTDSPGVRVEGVVRLWENSVALLPVMVAVLMVMSGSPGPPRLV